MLFRTFFVSRRGARLITGVAIAAAHLTFVRDALGQQLVPKRALSPTSVLPCPAPPAGPTPARNDSPDVRRLVALGHEAAIVGDHRQARDVFLDAARLSPGDERIAYQLGRAFEELNDRPAAIREYCRFLALAPQASDAADVRARIGALTAPATGGASVADQANAHFRTGIVHLEQRRWREASDAFGRVIQALPRAAEAYYDRAIALAALDQRDAAVRDLEQYLTLRPGAEDQAAVRQRMSALRGPTWNSRTALVTGLALPGLGQVYTSRPWIGLGVAALAGSSLYFAFVEKDEQEIRDYSVTIPGFPEIINIDTVTVTKHPYYAVGLSVFAAATIGAAFEAARYARRSRGDPIRTDRPPAAARVGAIELFAPDVVPERNGLAVRIAGRWIFGHE
jgi:tetratricopeptide (TPR) repeat protein